MAENFIQRSERIGAPIVSVERFNQLRDQERHNLGGLRLGFKPSHIERLKPDVSSWYAIYPDGGLNLPQGESFNQLSSIIKFINSPGLDGHALSRMSGDEILDVRNQAIIWYNEQKLSKDTVYETLGEAVAGDVIKSFRGIKGKEATQYPLPVSEPVDVSKESFGLLQEVETKLAGWRRVFRSLKKPISTIKEPLANLIEHVSAITGSGPAETVNKQMNLSRVIVQSGPLEAWVAAAVVATRESSSKSSLRWNCGWTTESVRGMLTGERRKLYLTLRLWDQSKLESFSRIQPDEVRSHPELDPKIEAWKWMDRVADYCGGQMNEGFWEDNHGFKGQPGSGGFLELIVRSFEEDEPWSWPWPSAHSSGK